MDKVLSALVIHDIKNALALLETDLEQLNHHENVPIESQRAYLRCIDLKNRLINFLTLYKLDQSGLVPVIREIDLAEFIEDMINNSQSAMKVENHQGRQVTVQADFSRMKTGGHYEGIGMFDENLVELALESALNNALRYARHEVNVWFEQEEDVLLFRILDDGAGIGVEDKLNPPDVSSKASSTGLGLALCKAVAAAHGAGSVQIECVAGGGTLFTMELRSIESLGSSFCNQCVAVWCRPQPA